MNELGVQFKKIRRIASEGLDVLVGTQFAVFGITFLVIMGVMLFMLSIYFVAAGLVAAIGDNLSETGEIIGTVTFISITVLLYVAIAFIAIVVGGMGSGAILMAIDDVYNRRQKKSIKEYLKLGYEKKWSIAKVIILQSLVIALGLIFFIIPGLLAMLFTSLMVYIHVLEGKSARESLKRSYELVRDNFLALFGRLMLAYLIVYIASLLTSFIPLANIAVSLFAGLGYTVYIYVMFMEITKEAKN